VKYFWFFAFISRFISIAACTFDTFK